MSSFPKIVRLRQHFPTPRVEDIPGEVDRQLARLELRRTIAPGESVAITAGSRGIANIAVILRAVAAHLRGLGGEPFLVPAMGSHGGGTVEGQLKILREYEITEENVGCPIRATMETVEVCRAAEGFPVHFDRHAFEADHVVVCGRVKPHTRFTGSVESGLMKMLLIGLGKHAGATVYHQAIMNHSFGQIVRSVAREVLTRCRIAAGLAIVENARDETALLEGVLPAEFEIRESELLHKAREWMPRLPFPSADLLLLDEIGKNISGAGMDTNVVGRKYYEHLARDDEEPKIANILVRGLSAATHGNACGIGFAEFCRTRVVEQMDREITRINCLTGGHASAAMVPIYYDTDREMVAAALGQIGLTPPAEARLLWIRHTLQVGELECSEAYLPQIRERPDLEPLSEPRELPFDSAGNLPDDWLGPLQPAH